MGKGYILFGVVLAVAIFSVFAFYQINSASTFSNLPSDSIVSLKHGSQVCIQVTDATGNLKDYQCTYNVLFNQGANNTRDYLGNGVSYGPFQNVSLCNSTAGSAVGCPAPTTAGTEVYNSAGGCGLISATAGTYTALGTVGNWTIGKTFTSTCDGQSTNVSRLTNSTGGIFAGASFTSVTLQTNDQLTLNWTVWNA